MRLATIAIALIPGLPAVLLCGEDAEFQKRFEEHKAALFGGETRLEGNDRVVVQYKEGAQFEKGFECIGLLNAKSLKGDRRVVEKPEGGEIPNVAAVGRDKGAWTSRFELSGDVELKFTLRMPAVPSGAGLTVSLNQSKKGAITTSFFQSASLMVGGKAKKRAQAPKDYLGSPDKWLDRKFLHTFTLAVKGGKFTVRMKREAADAKDAKEAELLVLEDAGEAEGGRIAISFQKISFALSDVTLSGKIDKDWCETQFTALDAKAVTEAQKKEKAEKSEKGAKGAKGKDGKKAEAKDEKKEDPVPPPAPKPKKALGDPAEKKKEAEEGL